MTSIISKTIIAAAALVAVTGVMGATESEARGRGQVYVQTYDLDRPLHGYSGKAGNLHCDYQRHPKRVCTVSASGKESCAIKGWTLQQMCY